MNTSVTAIGGRPTSWRDSAAFAQLRASLAGLLFFARLELLLILALAIQYHVTAFPTLTPGGIFRMVAGAGLHDMKSLLPVLPFMLIALHRAPPRPAPRVLWIAGTAVVAVLAAVAIGTRARVFEYLEVCAFVIAIFEFQRRASLGASALARKQLEVVALDAEMTSARLQLLRAQMEPHFLFNTLANIRQLARTDTEAAKQVLTDLMRYFSAALPRLRQERTTLAAEVELLDAYLNIYRIRMGKRLSYEITVPESLRGAQIPAMMLLTLVENSIKHGINPQTEGGAIAITANRGAPGLQLVVSDTGRGMTATAGSGTGLANIRSRLTLMYGGRAKLSLAQCHPHGVAAMITLPDEVNT